MSSGPSAPTLQKNSQVDIVTNLRWNFECAVFNAYCIEHTLPHARTGCAELLGRHAAVGGVSATSTCTCSDGRVLLYSERQVAKRTRLSKGYRFKQVKVVVQRPKGIRAFDPPSVIPELLIIEAFARVGHHQGCCHGHQTTRTYKGGHPDLFRPATTD